MLILLALTLSSCGKPELSVHEEQIAAVVSQEIVDEGDEMTSSENACISEAIVRDLGVAKLRSMGFTVSRSGEDVPLSDADMDIFLRSADSGVVECRDLGAMFSRSVSNATDRCVIDSLSNEDLEQMYRMKTHRYDIETMDELRLRVKLLEVRSDCALE